MSEDIGSRLPSWFWVVAVLSLLWELTGVAAFLGDMAMSPADLAALPEGQRQLHAAQPLWVKGAYGVAVFGGALGAIALLLRRTWARPLFILSLVAIIVQFSWAFGVAKAHEVVGQAALLFPVLIVILAITLIWFAGMAGKRGWLH